MIIDIKQEIQQFIVSPEHCTITYQQEQHDSPTILAMLQGLLTFKIGRDGKYTSSICDFFILRSLLNTSNVPINFNYSDMALDICKKYIVLRSEIDNYKNGKYNDQINPNLRSVPFFDQKSATSFLLFREQGINACSVGIGKTLSALSAYNILHNQKKVAAGIIFVTNNGKLTWKNEIIKHTNYTYKIIRNGTEKVMEDIDNFTQDLLVVHYDCLLSELVVGSLCALPINFVVLDEAHIFRNMNAKRSEAIHAIVDSWKPKYRYALTGTPVAERPIEVYSILKILNPLVVPAKTRFENYFCKKILIKPKGRRQKVPIIKGYKNLEQLKYLVDMWTFRKTHDDVEGFPETMLTIHKTELGEEQRAVYDRIKEETYKEIAANPEKALHLNSIITKTLRLRQYLVHPFLLGETQKSAKFEALDALLSEILDDKKQKVIVWSSFRPALDMVVNKYSEGYGAALNAGIANGLTMQQRSKNIEDFINPKSGCRILASILDDEISASSNLGIARTAIYLDEPLSLLTLTQSRGRIQRRDAKGTSTLIVLNCEDTVDEWVRKLLERKESFVNQVVNPDEELIETEDFLSVLKGSKK